MNIPCVSISVAMVPFPTVLSCATVSPAIQEVSALSHMTINKSQRESPQSFTNSTEDRSRPRLQSLDQNASRPFEPVRGELPRKSLWAVYPRLVGRPISELTLQGLVILQNVRLCMTTRRAIPEASALLPLLQKLPSISSSILMSIRLCPSTSR